MTTSSPASPVVDDVAQAASPVRVSRSIMVGNVADDDNDDDDDSFLDVSQSNSSNAATRGSTSMMQVNTTIDDGFDDDAQSASSKSTRAKSSFNIENLFQESVADAGLNAYGCVFIEVWIMLPDGTALIRVEPGGALDGSIIYQQFTH